MSLALATSSSPATNELELRPGLPAELIDGHLMRAAKGRDLSNRILAFYLDEMHESGKHQHLGYSCVAQYASQRLGLDPRRARELCQAGRALAHLTRIDQAFLDGVLCWTKAELMTHGVQECEQHEWIERAQRSGCRELRQMLSRHRRGLPAEKTSDGGLPQPEFGVHATFRSATHEKLERIRELLMRKRGVFVDDNEVLEHVVDVYTLPDVDVEADAKRAAVCEQDETPDWLRRLVLARDGHACQACGTNDRLHAHHIVFRSQGGATRAENLVTVCLACHGLIHGGRLFARERARNPGATRAVEFHNRRGEPLICARPTNTAAAPVLRRLRRDLDYPDGDRPDSAGGGRSPRTSSRGAIPEKITGDWFLANMHLFEPGRDGVWRPRKSVPRNDS